MGEWQYQLRVYLAAEIAERVRAGEVPEPLRGVLARHGAVMVSQFDAFSDYVAEAEREGVETYPLYRWTKAVLDDPAARARHVGSFALRVGGAEVYPALVADGLEADVRPLVGGGVVLRMSRHDTDPGKTIAVPGEYR